MSYEVSKLLSFSIAFGVIIAIFRIGNIDRRFFPFIILLSIGLITEVISSYYITIKKESNASIYNTYALIECTLLLCQFMIWKVVSEKTFACLMIIFCTWWLLEGFYFSAINVMNSTFIIGYTIVIIWMSMDMIIKMLFYEDYRLWRNPKFIISTGLLVFFSISMLVELFWIFHLNEVWDFKSGISAIRNYINFFVNLLFAIAVLWMPKRPRYTLAW